MENRIIGKKLLFLYHLETLPPNSLASEVYSIQKSQALPGLAEEIPNLLADLCITDSARNYTKAQWKKLVKLKVAEKKQARLVALHEKLQEIGIRSVM